MLIILVPRIWGSVTRLALRSQTILLEPAVSACPLFSAAAAQESFPSLKIEEWRDRILCLLRLKLLGLLAPLSLAI